MEHRGVHRYLLASLDRGKRMMGRILVKKTWKISEIRSGSNGIAQARETQMYARNYLPYAGGCLL